MAGIIAGNSPVLGPRGGAAADGHTIVSILSNGDGNPLFTTAAPHGLVGSENVTISGASNVAYNGGMWSVDAVVSPYQWVTGGGYSGDSTGGTWALV